MTSIFNKGQINPFAMSNTELVAYAQNQLEAYTTQDKTYGEVRLSDMQKLSGLLQRPVLFAEPGATEIKQAIDNLISPQFTTEKSEKHADRMSNARNLTMQEYYQRTKQYSQFAK